MDQSKSTNKNNNSSSKKNNYNSGNSNGKTKIVSKKKFEPKKDGSIPRELPKNKILVFLQMFHSHLATIVGSDEPDIMVSKFKSLKDSSPQKYSASRSLFTNMSKDIFGTWMPRVKFNGTTFSVTSVTGILATVVRLRPSELSYFTSFAGIFDEFRFEGPIVATYRPSYEIASTGDGAWSWAVGVIDFVDSSALASTAGALMFDTAKIFLLPMSRGSNRDETNWHTKLIGQPDLIWRDTGDTTTDVAWWKSYNYVSISGSHTYGVVAWTTTIEFRQTYGI